MACEILEDLCLAEFRGKEYPLIARLAVGRGDGEKLLAGQRIMLRQSSTAAAHHAKASASAAPLADPVRPGERYQQPDARLFRIIINAGNPANLPGRLAHPLLGAAIGKRASTAQGLDA